MASRLSRLKITKVSLVPRGADQDAHVVLVKSADPPAGVAAAVARAVPEAQAALARHRAAEAKTPRTRLAELAAAEMATDPSLTSQAAIAKAADTPEGRAAWRQIRKDA